MKKVEEERKNMKEVTLLEMLESGVHFGHQTSKWHPKMKPYIFTARNGVHILNLEITTVKLKEALEFVKETAKAGGLILFLGTKRQAKDIVKKYGQDCSMPYITDKWLGGTFTNFSNVIKLVSRLKDLRTKFQSGEIEKYSKKERSVYQNEMEKLERLVGGLENMTKLPQAIFIIDTKEEDTAVREANKKGVPIVAIVDTNVNPDKINYPIPGNDDATKSIDLITSLISQAAKEGKAITQAKEAKKKKEEMEKEAEIKVKEDVKKKIEEIEEEEKEVTPDQVLKS